MLDSFGNIFDKWSKIVKTKGCENLFLELVLNKFFEIIARKSKNNFIRS